MKRSLKISFAVAVILTISGTAHPLYAQPTPKSQTLPTPKPRTLPAPTPPPPCCSITAINATTGVVTAKVNATGNIFQFKVTNAALLNSLKIGQGVYANFATGQVSLDGSTMCCSIISPPQAPAPLAGPITAPKSAPLPPAGGPVGKPAPGAPATAPMAVGQIQNRPTPGQPCCNITALNASTGVVTAKANATGRIFQFKLNDSALLHSLQVSQGVYANFTAKQVSINGSTPAGSIIIGETAYTGFDPTKQGFNFTNFFTGQILIDIPLFGTRDLGPTSYGLCGGMSYAALDNFISGGTLPNNPNDKTPPVSGTPLRSYLYARQHDTFVDDNAWMIRQFIEWVAYPDTTALGVTGLDVRSFKQFLDNIQPQLAAGHPVPLGLVKANISVGSVTSTDENVLVKNHQVLAIGYKLDKDPVNGTHWDIQIYDPNYPGSIQLMHTHSNVAGYQTYDGSRTQTESFRGFFATPYSPKQPYWVPGGQLGNAVAISGPAPNPASAPQRVSPSSEATKASSPAASVSHAVQDSAIRLVGLPSVTAGTPQLVPRGGPQMAPIGPMGNRVNKDVVHLRGPDGIQQATNLPEGAKNLLLLHAYTLGPGEVDHYIVNTKLAADWINSHPALAKVQPPSSHDSHAGCSALSINCAEQAGKHVVSEAERQTDAFLNASRDEWQHVTHELSHDLRMAEGCFADQTLHLNDVPVAISPNDVPDLTFRFEKGGKPNSAVKANNQFGAITGSAEVTGTLTFGLPMDAHFKAGVDMFWIECLPFVIRPKIIHADGTFAVGTKIGAELAATGQFTQEFNIAAGRIPIAMIPIVIAGVPIAEMDVSTYLEGKVLVDGNGKLDAKFSLETQRQTNDFDFACSGHGCELNSHGGATKPETTSESVKLDGRIHVKPEVYVALQLDFDFDALSARAGPQPYLLGEVYACGAASGTQTAGGPSTSQDSYALTADLDWGIDLRAEALVGGAQVGDRVIKKLLRPQHIAFWDLAHSTALLSQVQGLTQTPLGQAALYQIKMPACYPYPDKVKYQLAWTGGATASNVTPGATTGKRSMAQQPAALKLGGNGTPSPSTGSPPPCNLQSGQGYCEFDPVKDLSLDLAWPAAGNYNLTVTAVGDTPHGRQYNSAQPTTLNVTVGSSGSGTSTSSSSGGTPPAPPSGSGTSTSSSSGGTPPAPPSGSGTATSASTDGKTSAPPRPCCGITAVDQSSGVVTARVMSTGDIFQFKVTDSATLNNLQRGQGVFANLPARRVSLNGRGSCCDIISVSPAQPAGAGGPTSSSNQAARVTNPQAAGIYRDPNPNHLPDLVPDIGTFFGECPVPAGSTCQDSCGSKKIPRPLGVQNLAQYPANGPIKIILTEMASGATRNWTVNGVGVDLNQWADPGGFYTMWKCPTGDSYSNLPDNYTLEVQGPPQLTPGTKIKSLYIPPDAVLCPGKVDFSGCQQ